jgi:hypothetical protein
VATHVQTVTSDGLLTGTSAAVSISSTAGNTLVVVLAAYVSTNTAYHVSSVTDTASNAWTYSTLGSNQNPPVGSSWDGSLYGLSLIGAVVNASHVTSVTVNFSASVAYLDVILYEFSGVAAGSSILLAASSSTLVNSALSVTTAALAAPAGALAISTATQDGSTVSSVSSPWTLDGGADHSAAYIASTSAGSLSATWTGAATQNWMSNAIAIIGGASGPPPARPLLIAPGWRSPSSLSRTLPPPPPPPTPIVAATAGLSGAGTLGVTGTDVKPGAAVLTGAGTFVATGTATGAVLTGQGTLSATGTDVKPGAAVLTGQGSLVATETQVALEGEGVLGALGLHVKPGAAALAGTGTFGITGEILGYVAQLTGQGSFVAYETEQFAALSGAGSFVVLGEKLGFVVGLFGTGSLSIPQVVGGLVNGVGGVGFPQALPGSSQVAVAPPGSSNWQWVGTLGQVTALTYSYVCPGGCDKMTMTLMVPASYRNQMLNPGWQVKITRGGHQVWDGKLDEPTPSPSGWTITATGTGNLGQNFVAYYSVNDVWPASEPDEIINRAIIRGLPWVNPGYNSSSIFSQFWMGQGTDPGTQTVTAFLNLICTRGGLTWYVNSQPGGLVGDDLNIFPLPTVPSRLLVSTTPVARTLGGDINTIFIRYMSAADNTTTGTPAQHSVVSVQNAASVAAHGVMETYIDLSDVGVQTITQAQAVGNNVLAIYQRASFAGPITGGYGQLLTLGGTAIDPGTDQAGTMVRLILTDYGYGGEVTPQFPLTFIVGSYSWDDFAQQFSITPYQSLNESLTGLLGMENTIMVPIQAATSGP